MSYFLSALRCAVPSFYAVTLLLYLLRFLRRGERAGRYARPVFWSSLALHGLFLVVFIVANRRIPLANLPEILSVVAFAVALAYFYVELRTGKASTGLFVLAFPLLFQLASSGRISLVQEVSPLLKQPVFGLHTGTAILGYSSFAVSTIYGVLFLLLYRSLKATRFGLIYKRLPPLEILSKMCIRAAVLGLASLTLAILTGAFWAARLYPGFATDPMFLLTLVVWSVYAFCVLAHYGFKWRGQPTAYISIAGFLLLGIGIVAIHLIFPSFHRFDLV